MQFNAPGWLKPEEYPDVPRSIDELFNSYAKIKQGQQENALRTLDLGFDPSRVTPGMVEQAQQPRTPSMANNFVQAGNPNLPPEQQFMQESPTLAGIRSYIERRNKSRETSAEKDRLGLELTNSQIKENNAKALALGLPKTPESLKPEQRAAIEGQIMDDYLKSPTFSNLAAAKSGLRDLASIQNNKSGAADIAAIYSFVKTMDNNAVKEGEIQLAQSALPGLDRVKLIVDRMKSGNQITPEMKRELLTVAKGMYESKLRSANEFRTPFLARAKQYGINPDIAAPGFEIPQQEWDAMAWPEQPSAQPGPIMKTLKDGRQVKVMPLGNGRYKVIK